MSTAAAAVIAKERRLFGPASSQAAVLFSAMGELARQYPFCRRVSGTEQLSHNATQAPLLPRAIVTGDGVCRPRRQKIDINGIIRPKAASVSGDAEVFPQAPRRFFGRGFDGRLPALRPIAGKFRLDCDVRYWRRKRRNLTRANIRASSFRPAEFANKAAVLELQFVR